MEIALWIVQGLMAFVFLMLGFMKMTQPRDKIKEKMAWVNDFSSGTLKFIGFSEVLGALGLIIPWWTGTLPILTPIAASALGLVMILAAMVHARRKEQQMLLGNILLLLLLVFVAFGRF